MIRITKYTELDENIKAQLNVFIHNEFGHIPIVNETEWATPDWTIIYFIHNDIATFYNIVERTILIDKQPFKIAGINNVITPKEFRGKGYATKILNDTQQLIFEDLKCDFGLLLCADNLIPFYQRLNWYPVNCPVHFEQSSGKKLWQANTMILSPGKRLDPREIDLNGLPW